MLTRLRLPLALAALSLCPMAASAQDAGGSSGLSTGEVITEDAPQPGQTYIRDTAQDWEVRCLRETEERLAAGAEEVCQMYQLLRDNSGTPTAEIVLFKVESDDIGAGATIITPLETLLTRGLTLAIDDGLAKRYPFNFCNEQGCVVQLGFTNEEVEQMKRGSAGNIVIVPAVAQNTEVELRMSLSGFTAAIDQLPVRSAIPQ